MGKNNSDFVQPLVAFCYSNICYCLGIIPEMIHPRPVMRILLCICISSQVGTVHYKSHFFLMICDVIKQNETEVEKCFFFLFVCLFVLWYCLGFYLVKTPLRLDNWFQ